MEVMTNAKLIEKLDAQNEVLCQRIAKLEAALREARTDLRVAAGVIHCECCLPEYHAAACDRSNEGLATIDAALGIDTPPHKE